MNLLREIREISSGVLTIEIPPGLRNRKVEILVFPLEENPHEEMQPLLKKAWAPDFLEKTSGCLADDPIFRPPQGDFEIREPFK